METLGSAKRKLPDIILVDSLPRQSGTALRADPPRLPTDFRDQLQCWSRNRCDVPGCLTISLHRSTGGAPWSEEADDTLG
eukprot:scaffold289617_cov24-Tisochrysis_lutea.AAC.1